MDAGRCHGCGEERRVTTVLSAHRTSEGTVVYDRCQCGRAGVRLVRSTARAEAPGWHAPRPLVPA